MNYKQNYLTNVILRFDFNPISTLTSDKELSIHSKIKDSYPKSRFLESKHYDFLVNDAGHVVNSNINPIWDYRNGDGKRVVQISSSFLTFERLQGAHTNFDDFYKEICDIIQLFFREYHLDEVGRIGLRYINQFDLPGDGHPLDWKDWLSDNIAIACTAGLDWGMKAIRSMHQVRLDHEGNTALMNYGLFNSEYPNPIAKKEFVLDIDCYTSGGIPLKDFERKSRDLNKLAEYIFERCIGDKLRAKMGGQNV